MPPKIITGELKRYEEEIITFFQIVGDNTGLNFKTTRIFAYLQVYKALTQKQLKNLTKFSSSTISTTLNSFLQSGIVTREIGTNARVGIYRLKSEKVPFVYTEFSEIMIELENLDKFIVTTQEEVNKFQEEYPMFCEFIRRRLNSFRNYIEAQRRAIKESSKYSFFIENLSDLGLKENIISIPDKLEPILKKFVTYMVDNGVYNRDDPIANLVFSYMSIYGFITQELLVQLTGLSLSTISRTLNHFMENDTISSLPKQYKQSRIYELPSVSLIIISQILKADAIIFSWQSKFQNLLNNLEKTNLPKSYSLELIKRKIMQVIAQISEFKDGSNRLENAKDELLVQYNLKK
ncbi:MAG: MarR family transcriptional regulator [Promethearchaeota archaeon]|nr:MAG: MarR family transcriptional regulator [Candidatus Lokiarchaeota archaeon]